MSATTSVRRAACSAAQALLVAAIAWPAIAFGGVYPWAYGILMALCGLFALCALAGGGWRVDASLTLCAASVMIAVALQLVPLAPATLRVVSPQGAAFLEHQDLNYALIAAAGIRQHPLSIDPPATWRFLEFWIALTALFAGVASLAATMSLRFVATSVTAIGAALALVGIVQTGAGSNRMYGVWDPLTHTAVFGPFVNRNHFATWMLMALPVAIAQCAAQLAAVRRDEGPDAGIGDLLRSPRAGKLLLAVFASVLIAVALLMTGSRSGIGGFLVIVGAMAGMQLGRRRSARAAAPVAAYVMVIACIAVAWVGYRPLLARLDDLPGTRLSGRLDAWSEAWPVARAFWLTGSGLNSYATAMLAYHDPKVPLFFRTPHSDYLQTLCDGGVLVGLPIGILIALVAVRVVRASPQPLDGQSSGMWTRYGAAIGLGAVALQELVDFGLQTPANAVVFVVLAAYVVSVHAVHPARVFTNTVGPGAAPAWR